MEMLPVSLISQDYELSTRKSGTTGGQLTAGLVLAGQLVEGGHLPVYPEDRFHPVLGFLAGLCIRLESLLPVFPQRGYYGKRLDTSAKCLYMDVPVQIAPEFFIEGFRGDGVHVKHSTFVYTLPVCIDIEGAFHNVQTDTIFQCLDQF
ncbi:hypothetical protein FF38_06587 [Lucilia cuprina]|uniref:Uncharacterized protein n=1 Tax=Lucilia cuprina TaxID=7375 RepID=A0A0L0CB04_LUCCU|nr:hypothetical protein FF38_06587 [Lucilia cuprina]